MTATLSTDTRRFFNGCNNATDIHRIQNKTTLNELTTFRIGREVILATGPFLYYTGIDAAGLQVKFYAQALPHNAAQVFKPPAPW